MTDSITRREQMRPGRAGYDGQGFCAVEGADLAARADGSAMDHAPDWVFDYLTTGISSAGGVSADMNTPGLFRPAENVLMVYGCIVARRSAIAKVPVRVSDPDGNVVEDGPLVDLLSYPFRSQRMSWRDYVSLLETYSTLYNCIAVAKVGEPGQLPDELVPLNPMYVMPILGTHEPTGTPAIVEYRYADPLTGRITMWKPEDLLIHRGFNPHAPLAPLSPLMVLRRTMQQDIGNRETNLALLNNDTRPAGVLENDQFMHKEQAEEVLNFWEARMKGVQNRYRPMATWGGLKWREIGLTPMEMDYLNSLKFLRTDYYIVFRIPPAMLYEMMPTEMGKGNEATASQKVQWWEDVGLSELDLISALHQPLADDFYRRGRRGGATRKMDRGEVFSCVRTEKRAATSGGLKATGYKIWFNENAIPALVEQRLAKTKQAGELLAMGYRPDDINDALDLNLPPHTDNLGRVASTLVVIGPEAAKTEPKKIEPQRSEPQKTEQQTDQADPAKKAMETLDRLEKIATRSMAEPADPNKAEHRPLQKAFEKFVAPREKKAAKKLSRFFFEQRGRVLDRMRNAERGARSEAARAEGEQSDELLKRIFPRGEEDHALVARLTPLWKEHLSDGARFFSTETGIAVRVNVESDPRAIEAIEARKIQGLKINDTTEEALRSLLKDAFEAGDTNAMISDRIAEYYADNAIGDDSVRAATAARTQTAGIVNDGKMIAAREAGDLEKFWVHGNPAMPRPDHVAAAERYQANPIPVDEPFQINGLECDAPGDPSLPPEEVCNCGCTVGFRRKVA